MGTIRIHSYLQMSFYLCRNFSCQKFPNYITECISLNPYDYLLYCLSHSVCITNMCHSIMNILMIQINEGLRRKEKKFQLQMSVVKCVFGQKTHLNTKVLTRASLPSIYTILMQSQLHWASHVVHMKGHHLLKKLLNGKLSQSKRSQGGQKKCLKDTLKVSLKSFGITPNCPGISGARQRQMARSCQMWSKSLWN